MIRINILIFLSCIFTAAIIGGAGASIFISKNENLEKIHFIPQECNTAQKETFRRGTKSKNTGLDKGY